MKRKIHEWPSIHLTKKAEAVSEDELENMRKVEIDLIDTCNINMGVGLAATQIGVRKRMVVIKPEEFGVKDYQASDYNSEYLTMINPVLSCSEEKKKWKEACLSIPFTSGGVERCTSCEVSYIDLDGVQKSFKAEWPFAGGLQHECDHLDGVLYVDKMKRSNRHATLEKMKRQKKKIKVSLRKYGVK